MPRELLEPEAPGDARHTTDTEEFDAASLRSIAISLKRIADALNETNEYGEGPAAAVGAGLARALRDFRT